MDSMTVYELPGSELTLIRERGLWSLKKRGCEEDFSPYRFGNALYSMDFSELLEPAVNSIFQAEANELQRHCAAGFDEVLIRNYIDSEHCDRGQYAQSLTLLYALCYPLVRTSNPTDDGFYGSPPVCNEELYRGVDLRELCTRVFGGVRKGLMRTLMDERFTNVRELIAPLSPGVNVDLIAGLFRDRGIPRQFEYIESDDDLNTLSALPLATRTRLLRWIFREDDAQTLVNFSRHVAKISTAELEGAVEAKTPKEVLWSVARALSHEHVEEESLELEGYSVHRLMSVESFERTGRELENCLKDEPDYALEARESPVYALRENGVTVAAFRLTQKDGWSISEIHGASNSLATPRQVTAAMKVLSTVKETT